MAHPRAKQLYQNRFGGNQIDQGQQIQNQQINQQQQQLQSQFTNNFNSQSTSQINQLANPQVKQPQYKPQIQQQNQQQIQQQQSQMFNQQQQQQQTIQKTPIQQPRNIQQMQQSSQKINYQSNIQQKGIPQAKSQQQQNKIDIDQIPRPIFTTEESITPKKFQTNSKNSIPPQVHQNYICYDEGSAPIRFIRNTFLTIPQEPSAFNETKIPLGAIIQPFADQHPEEEPIQVLDYGTGPFRCSRCKAYVNPNFVYSNGGNIAICNLCTMQNQVLPQYFSTQASFESKPHSRIENCRGIYEFIAPQEYNNVQIDKNLILFCIELTFYSLSNGMFGQIISSIQSCLDFIPNPERTDIAIVTFDSCLSFYNIPKNLNKELQILIIGDQQDPCVCLPHSNLFINIANEREKIDYLIEKLVKIAEGITENMQNSTQQQKQQYTSTSLGSVINNAVSLLNPKAGKTIIFGSSMPQIGFGKLKRKEARLLGTDKEKTLYTPQIDSYEQLARQSLKNKICIDLFLFPPDFIDIASLSPVVSITGGSLYYYPFYNQQNDYERLHYDIVRNLTRYVAQDCIMTLRTSPGLVLQEYYTGAGKHLVRDLEFSQMDSDKTIGVVYKLEDKIKEEFAYIQFAILYTNQSGIRLIRVINQSIKIDPLIQNVYRSADIDAVLGIYIRRTLVNLLSLNVKLIGEQLFSILVEVLYAYRVLCSQQSSPGQLILPEALKYLPLYFQSLLKQNVLKQGTNIKLDERSYEIFKYLTQSIFDTAIRLYPKLYPIHNFDFSSQQCVTHPGKLIGENTIIPSSIALTIEKIENNGIYLYDTVDTIFIHVLPESKEQIIQELFGVETFADIQTTQLPNLETDYSKQLQNIINQLRINKRGAFQNVKVVTQKQNDLEVYLFSLLVEDSQKSDQSYSDFLCTIHKKIQEKYN